VLTSVHGITHVSLVRELGQPSLTIEPDREKIARYGLNVADINGLVETAVGGAPVSQVIQGERSFDLVVRLQEPFRQNLEAIKEWRLALRYAPKDRHLREELLASLYAARDYTAALPLADELLRDEPASAALNMTKGDILLSSQETEKAIPLLKAAIKSDSKLLQAHHALGRAYMLAGKPEAAIPHLVAALPIDEDGSLRYQLSRAYESTGKAELARKMLEEYQQRQKADREEKSKLEEELKIGPP